MKKMILLAFGTLLAATSVRAEPFKDGDRVCFFGDSVTHFGSYTQPLMLFYYTRYPERDIRIWNCGVGGSTSGDAVHFVDGDIKPKNPTEVVILFGQNDVGLPYWLASAGDWMIKHRPDLLDAFKKNYPALVEKVKSVAPDAALTFCTLVPWDDTLKFKGKEDAKPPTGITAFEVPFCDVVRDCQKRFGGGLVEYYGPMLAWNTEHQKTDPYVSLSPDRIHPREPGGLFMATTFLRTQGVERPVCDVTVDVASVRVIASENATVTELVKTDAGGIALTLLEASLPYPVKKGALAMADELDVWKDLNRELLAAKNLPAGSWQLVVDGTNKVVVATAEEWSAGINLAKYETPMMRQAREVEKALAPRIGKEIALRHLWVDRSVLWRRLQRIDKNLFTPEDLDDPRIYKVFAMGYSEGKGENKPTTPYVRMAKDWAKRGEVEKEIEASHLAVRKLNRPVPHRFELVPETK